MGGDIFSQNIFSKFSKDNFIGLNYTPELVKRISSLGYTCEVAFDSSEKYNECVVKNQSLNIRHKNVTYQNLGIW